MLSGDVETGKTILRDYIKATVGLKSLAKRPGRSPRVLSECFGPRGNPQARISLAFSVIFRTRAGLELHVA